MQRACHGRFGGMRPAFTPNMTTHPRILGPGFGSSGVSFGHTRDGVTHEAARWIRLLGLLVGLLFASGCYRNATPSQQVSDEQLTVDRATSAITRMRSSGQFPTLASTLEHASGVMIFPRVVKAALLVGGGGGNGVLLARDTSGNWSAPAFFGLGGGSAGLELGYQEASVVIVFMNRGAMLSAIDRGLTLGADATVAAGSVGSAGANANATTSRDVHVYVDVGGVFVGASLDGAVVATNDGRNERYYGKGATTYRIVVDRLFDNPDSRALRAALSGG